MTDDTLVGPLASAPPWVHVARSYLGVRERRDGDDPDIVRWLREAKTPIEHLRDEIAWCGAFLGGVMREAGVEPPPKCYRAASWADWGEICPVGTVGAVLVINNPAAAKSITHSGNHVTLLLGASPTSLYCLGGNQGDAVSARRYPREIWSVRASRWPVGHPR